MEYYTVHVSDHYNQDFRVSHTLFTSLEKACDHLDKFFARYYSYGHHTIPHVDREAAKKEINDDNFYEEWEEIQRIRYSIYKYSMIE